MTARSVVCLLFLLPFLWALLTAIKPFAVAFTDPPTWSFTPTARPFTQLWKGTTFAFVFLDTVVVALAAMVVSLAVAPPAADAL